MSLLFLVAFFALVDIFKDMSLKQESCLTQSSDSNKSSPLICSPNSCVSGQHTDSGALDHTRGRDSRKWRYKARQSEKNVTFLLGNVLPLYEFNKDNTVLTFKIVFKDDKILTEASKHWVGRTDSCFPWVARTVSHVSV